jgi:hypothetical protein
LNRDKIEQSGVKLDDINKVLSRYMTKAKDFDIPTSKGSIPVDVYIDPVKTIGTSTTSSGFNDPQTIVANLAAETLTTRDGRPIRLDQLADIHVRNLDIHNPLGKTV